MTGGTMLVVVLLVAAAVLVAWPVRTVRARRRRVLAGGGGTAGVDPDEALVQWVRELGRTPGDPPPSGRPTTASPRPPTAGGGRTLAAPYTRDTLSGTRWAGEGGPTRPPGPARPPTRRDLRRPAGTTRPGAVVLDADPRADGSVAVPTVGVGEPEVDRLTGPSVGPADSRIARDADELSRNATAIPTVLPRDVGNEDPRVADRVGGGSRATATAGARPARALLLVCLVGAGAGAVVAGPVGGVAMGGYGTLIVRGLLRRRANRRADRVRRRALDQLCGLAADLRAGLPAPSAIDIASVGGSDRLRQLTSAAVRLADRTGAPLAELVERIEADARATDRGLAAAAAQAAGARATAWLLAGLPVGGIGLGYGIGVDPVAVLLHDTVGGICAIVAVALQVVGLLWAERLGATPGQAA
ncbi:hypothetical protein ACFY1S_12575 [Micromonospora sp. NPDC000663]|uniref:hypothetical protein n=1 Tax=Micromonospora sp. NPDC000663 TaxID=3364218 RepID=UPI003694B755